MLLPQPKKSKQLKVYPFGKNSNNPLLYILDDELPCK